MRQFFSVQAAGDAVPGLALTVGRRTFRLHLLHATLGEPHPGAHARRSSGHRHEDAYHAVLYTSGCNQFVLNGKTLICEPGTLALTAPADAHDFRPCAPGALQYSEVTFAFRDPAGRPLRRPFSELVRAAAGAGPAVVKPEVRKPTDAALCRQLTAPVTAEADGLYAGLLDALLAPDSLRLLRVHAAFAQMLLFWWRELEETDGARRDTSPSTQAVERVRQHLEQHVAEAAKIPRLAALARMSAGHFQRQFKRVTGLSPVQYLHRLRIRAAQTLLRTSALSCKEIAARVGFRDPAYFSRLVRRHTGRPPLANRQPEGP